MRFAIVIACFHQGGLVHIAGTSECHVLKSLHKCFNMISFLLSHCQESWYGNLRVIFKEAGEEKLLHITPVLDRAFWELHESFKSNSFQAADEQRCQDGST